MAKKKKLQAAQAPQYTPYDVSGKIGGDAFEVIGSDASSMEAIARPSISFMKDAWNRIKKSRVAVVCMVILALIILGAIFLPMICPFGYEQQNVAFQNKPIMSPDSVTGQMHIFGTDALGRDVVRKSLVWRQDLSDGSCCRGAYRLLRRCYLRRCVRLFRRRGRYRHDAYPGDHQRYSLSDHRYPFDDSYGERSGNHHRGLFTYRLDWYGPSGKRTGGKLKGTGICYRGKIHGSFPLPGSSANIWYLTYLVLLS